MKLTITACIILLVSLPAFCMDYEPWTYIQDFENRELNAWLSIAAIDDTFYMYLIKGMFIVNEKKLIQ